MSPASQERKAEAFAALHRGEPFVIPSPWTRGAWSRHSGFSALAT
jgi:hypothetical protein